MASVDNGGYYNEEWPAVCLRLLSVTVGRCQWKETLAVERQHCLVTLKDSAPLLRYDLIGVNCQLSSKQ